MKQLILYFLFFICAAFILIQCARLFPTDKKIPKHQPISQKAGTSSGNKKPATRVLQLSGLQYEGAGSKQTAFGLYFSGHAFPLTMMNYINQYQFLSYKYWSFSNKMIGAPKLFYNPYTNLTYPGFISQGNTGLIANNPLVQQ